MEARNTVMSYARLEEMVKEPDGCNNLFYAHDLHIAEFQAEISFKAGMVQGKMDYLLVQSELIIEAKKAGIREVMELLPKIPKRFKHNQTCFDCVENIKRQVKLKEWGVNNA